MNYYIVPVWNKRFLNEALNIFNIILFTSTTFLFRVIYTYFSMLKYIFIFLTYIKTFSVKKKCIKNNQWEQPIIIYIITSTDVNRDEMSSKA